MLKYVILALFLLAVLTLTRPWRRINKTVVEFKKGVRGLEEAEESLSPPEPARDDNVQFTVYRPKSVVPEKWYALLAFAHLAEKRHDAPAAEPDPVVEVQQQAKRVLGEQFQSFAAIAPGDATHTVPHHAELTFVPEIDGVTFNPPRRTFHWTESVHREEFRMKADASLEGETARGRMSVFLGDILLADISMAIKVSSATSSDADMASDRGRPYRKIFASYSHKDAAIVDQFERFARTMGDEYLRDWKTLRAGEVWGERLLQMIEEADVFQLFWSRNAMESSEVRKEIDHALSLGRSNFVRPTYWEDPMPRDPSRDLPPSSLLRLHFQRVGSRSVEAPPAASLTEGIATVRVIGGCMIEGTVGQGAMGTVYRGVHAATGRKVIIRLGPGEAPAVSLNHPGIVRVLDTGFEKGTPYTVVEDVGGDTLGSIPAGGSLNVGAVVQMFAGITEALHYAHSRGVVHGNLAPTRVRLASGGRPMIDEFAPPAVASGEGLTNTGMVSGNPAYMAPERLRGGVATPAADVFSVGVMLYEVLTGQRPFRGDTALEQMVATMNDEPMPVRRLNPSVPSWLADVVMSCLAKSPERRFASMAELRGALQRWVEERELAAAGPPPRASRRERDDEDYAAAALATRGKKKIKRKHAPRSGGNALIALVAIGIIAALVWWLVS